MADQTARLKAEKDYREAWEEWAEGPCGCCQCMPVPEDFGLEPDYQIIEEGC